MLNLTSCLLIHDAYWYACLGAPLCLPVLEETRPVGVANACALRLRCFFLESCSVPVWALVCVMCVFSRVHIHVRKRLHTRTTALVHTHTHTHTHKRTSMQAHKRTHKHTQACTSTHKHARTHTETRTNTNEHTTGPRSASFSAANMSFTGWYAAISSTCHSALHDSDDDPPPPAKRNFFHGDSLFHKHYVSRLPHDDPLLFVHNIPFFTSVHCAILFDKCILSKTCDTCTVVPNLLSHEWFGGRGGSSCALPGLRCSRKSFSHPVHSKTPCGEHVPSPPPPIRPRGIYSHGCWSAALESRFCVRVYVYYCRNMMWENDAQPRNR
jgi:hypothetical protein